MNMSELLLFKVLEMLKTKKPMVESYERASVPNLKELSVAKSGTI